MDRATLVAQVSGSGLSDSRLSNGGIHSGGGNDGQHPADGGGGSLQKKSREHTREHAHTGIQPQELNTHQCLPRATRVDPRGQDNSKVYTD